MNPRVHNTDPTNQLITQVHQHFGRANSPIDDGVDQNNPTSQPVDVNRDKASNEQRDNDLGAASGTGRGRGRGRGRGSRVRKAGGKFHPS